MGWKRKRRDELEAIVEHDIALREDTIEAGEEIVLSPDWQGAYGYLEDALKRAQEGQWHLALELRDKARELTK